MERGAGDSAASPARAGAGGMCDRLLTFLANGLSMNRQKSITEGPRNVGSGGGYHQLEDEEDAFAIRIERAEFEFSDHGDEGHTTVLEDSTSTATATESDEQQQQKGTATADASADHHPVAAAAAPAVEETKIRKTVTIKEDRPEEGKGAPALERKKSLFSRKRQASTSSSGGGAGEEQGGQRAPRRSGLRPRMPAVLRVPSNINEKSSTFIEERRKSFGSGGKTAPAGNK
ncbi:hypothetical protein PR202_ga22597 [Eleusine coracana subsp. coracana]|uniref:Uncharacterized protein n=1 Tax=Eleusine coracana subsp. coracana TaxID=191504 RepID=A0AAV5D311_ELECO|nr:hypothetical protein PR202_ga22597 [Eleusine coracana subsp. coracana]